MGGHYLLSHSGDFLLLEFFWELVLCELHTIVAKPFFRLTLLSKTEFPVSFRRTPVFLCGCATQTFCGASALGLLGGEERM